MVLLLRRYIESKYCPGGSSKINMINEIKKQVLSSPEMPVIIVVDISSALYMIHSEIAEVLSGGRHTLFRNRLRHLFKGLVDAGATLVFFTRGPVKEWKLCKWMDRANEKYQSYEDVFESNIASKEIDLNKVDDSRTLYHDTYVQTAKEFGQVHVAFENNRFSDATNYASEVKAFAVIAGNNDYLIFPGDWRVWRIVKKEWDCFTAIEYSKKNLRSNLMLKQKHMPIFAALCGNRYMPLECVQHIRDSLYRGGFQRRLAELIRRLCPDGTPLSDSSKNALIKLICTDQKTTFSEVELRKLLEDSINFYDSSQTNGLKIEPLWLHNYTLETQSVFLFRMMKNLPLALSQFYIDARQPNVKQFFELALPIFQRQIGILLRDADENHAYVVIYKPNHDEPFQRETVKAIKPTITLSPIRDVLTNPQMQFSTKLDILTEILFPGNVCLRERLNDLDIKNINFVPILKICYLKENNQITTEEADILLLSAHESCTIDNEHRQMLEAPKIFNSRAFWIAMTYNNLSFYFFDSLTLSGLDEFVTADTFDGYIFHNLYAKFFQYNKGQRDKLLQSVKNFRIYID